MKKSIKNTLTNMSVKKSGFTSIATSIAESIYSYRLVRIVSFITIYRITFI